MGSFKLFILNLFLLLEQTLSSPVIEDKRKSAQKSTKKVVAKSFTSLNPTAESNSKQLLKNVLQSAIKKSSKKRGTKRVLFPVDANSSDLAPDTVNHRNKRRIITTSKAAFNHIYLNTGENYEDDIKNRENNEPNFTSASITVTNVSVEHGGRSSRLGPAKKSEKIDEEPEESPLSGFEGKSLFTPTRLFF